MENKELKKCLLLMEKVCEEYSYENKEHDDIIEKYELLIGMVNTFLNESEEYQKLVDEEKNKMSTITDLNSYMDYDKVLVNNILNNEKIYDIRYNCREKIMEELRDEDNNLFHLFTDIYKEIFPRSVLACI